MKKILFIVLFLLFSCQNEYTQFHKEKEKETQIQTEINNFSFEQIKYLSGLTLKGTPNLKIVNEIVEKINNSNSRVYLEMYILTEKDIIKALVNAKKRNIEIKVILEKNVYLANNLNVKTFKYLETNGIEIVYSNSKNYDLNHSKMMIIDNEVIISTGNYSHSTFKYNKEFFLFLKNSDLLKIFLDIFLNDFKGIKKNISNPNIVLSPFSSRPKLEYLIKNAKKSINMYVYNFSDENIKKILLEKQKQGIKIKIIFPDLKKVSSNEEMINSLIKNYINLQIVDNPKIHAKSILIDEKYLYIGSINFSDSSIDKNREIGLLIINEEIIKQFIEEFNTNFKNNKK